MAKPQRMVGVRLTEAAKILGRLEHRRVKPSRVRSMLVLGPDACALQPMRQGVARVFTADDLSIGCVLLRLHKAEVSPVVARVIVEHCREELLHVWAHRRPMALAVIGRRGLILWRGNQPEQAIAWVDLGEVRRGVEAALADAETVPMPEKDADHGEIHAHA